MSAHLLLVTLSIILVAQATDPPVKPVNPALAVKSFNKTLGQPEVPGVKPLPTPPPGPPVSPVMPAPAVKTVRLAEAAVSSGNSGKTFEGVGIKPKLWVKYVAVPDVKKGSNVTISGYRSGKILGCGKMNDGQLRRSDFFRIVGGKTGKVPWQVAVIKRETSGLDVNSLHCGGSILDETHIMTAAHCTRQNGPLILDVMIGKYNFKDRESGATRHKVEKIIDHPKYNHKTMDYDYSILKLNCDDAIDLGSNSPARAICLPKKGYKENEELES